ncbi:MAG: hypothetical protein JNL08_04515 [Planctomycetes bacterium]|nr:hypothetical protein [Planctomycetota bacterium]
MDTSSLRGFAAVLAAVALTAALPAQCSLVAEPGDPVSMPRGRVLCSANWDPDGGGPLPVALVMGGEFEVAAATSRVAMFDGSAWTTLGAPGTGATTALTVYNGDLVAAVGERVFRRTGGSWVQIGITHSGATIDALVVWNGELVAGGDFVSMNGAGTNDIARWNGTTWAALGTGIATGSVKALAVYTYLNQSALYVGGQFSAAGGVSTSNLAIWTGAAWAATPGCNGTVHALAVRLTAAVTTSYLILGGDFTVAGGVAVDKVARFSVATNSWTNLGAMPSAVPVTRLLVRSQVSSYEVAAAQGSFVSLWAGGAWNQLGTSLNGVQFLAGATPVTVQTVAYFGGRYVAGLTDASILHEIGGVWTFDGVAWQTVDGAGVPRPVLAVQPLDGDLAIGGDFRTISGVTVNGVARGSANAWAPLGGGVTGGTGAVRALARLPNGDLVAGGTFRLATGGVADHIARWNGTAWLPLGSGTNAAVSALLVLPNGDLVAGGEFTVAGGVPAARVARWTGTAWSEVGGGCNGAVQALCQRTDGTLVMGGSFTVAGVFGQPAERVAYFDGFSWRAYGDGVGGGDVLALAETPNGGLLVGGSFQWAGSGSVDHLAQWNGSSFTEVPYDGTPLDRPVHAIACLPDNTILVGTSRQLVSDPTSSVATSLLQLRPTSDDWEAVLLGGSYAGDAVKALAVTADGAVIAGGYFDGAGSTITANVARLVSTCPAQAQAYGSGCTGTGGANVLAARTLPWERAWLRTIATGMPAQGVAVALFGFTPVSLPLVAVLPEALPGCNLLTTPDVMQLGLTVAGAFETSIYVAPFPSLVGVHFYHQVVPLDVGSGSIVITATNGLDLVGGAY